MKRYFSTLVMPVIILGALLTTSLLDGCYYDTINSVKALTLQLPLQFKMDWYNRIAPDTSYDFTDLETYKEYRDNKADIDRAIFHQFAYWIDSLVVAPGDPAMEDVEFEFIRYELYFTDMRREDAYLLGEFRNVKVKDYLRKPHVLAIPDSVAMVIEEAVRRNPRFHTIATYSSPKSGGSGRFPLIISRFDVILRLKINLF